MTDHMEPDAPRPRIPFERIISVILLAIAAYYAYQMNRLEATICGEIEWKSVYCEKAKEGRLR